MAPLALLPRTELIVKVLPLAKMTSSRPVPGMMVPPWSVELGAPVPKRIPPVAIVRVLAAAIVAVQPLVPLAALKRSELIV